MKVLTEKKATLSIYTEADYTTDKKMEREVSLLRRELDETRAALRLQTTRCRQLVAAYSARLRDRDEQLRAGNALRDHQLALVLRALLALEARLRREQKAIRAQLAQRDAVIHQQQLEISRLRGHSPWRNPPPPATTPSELIVVNHTCGEGSQCHDEPPSGKSPKRRSKPKDDKYLRRHVESHETVVDASHHLKHQEATLRVLELVDPNRDGLGTPIPLLNGETASIVDAGIAGIETPTDFIEDVITPPPDAVASYNEMNRECLELASMAASLRADGSVKEEATDGRNGLYQHNPVLECVNLILLRDQEDYQEERRRVDDSPDPPEHQEPAAWYNTKERAQLLQEKEVLRMSTQRLTVMRSLDFEDVDANGNSTKKTPTTPERKPRSPPALPPKPSRLLPTRPSPPKAKPGSPDKRPPPPPVRTTVIAAREGHLDSTSPSSDGAPRIISNGNGAFNLVKKSRPETLPRPQTVVAMVHHTSTEPHPAPRPAVNGCRENGETVEDAKNAKMSSIRVSSSVTSLITGNTSESIVNELAGTEDDDGNAALRRNFEEFNLDECDIEGLGEDVLHEGRPDGDGAEARNGLHQDIMALAAPADANLPALVLKDVNDGAPPASYDTFLEATGLSTKSILTPSRMLSNHRSVLKPKDVKHRSRVKAERCLSTTAGGPTVKYWTEPFL